MKTFSSKLLYSIDKHCFTIILPTIFVYYTKTLVFCHQKGLTPIPIEKGLISGP